MVYLAHEEPHQALIRGSSDDTRLAVTPQACGSIARHRLDPGTSVKLELRAAKIIRVGQAKAVATVVKTALEWQRCKT